MMDPIYRIKDHIVALNAIPFEDERGLEQYLSDVRDTIRSYFSDRSQYFTFLSSIHFHPISVFSPTTDAVMCWAKGKKQVRELLMVMLADAQSQFAFEPVAQAIAAAQAPSHELKEAERIVSDHISSAEIAALPRVRIDLSDFYIPDQPGSVLFFSGRDEALNNILLEQLGLLEVSVNRLPSPFHSGRSIVEQFTAHSDAQMAIIALGEDCWISLNGMGKGADLSSPAPDVCFGLGYLAGCLGPGKVVALYRENPSFRRPTDSRELLYVSVDKSQSWRLELSLRLKQNRLIMK